MNNLRNRRNDGPQQQQPQQHQAQSSPDKRYQQSKDSSTNSASSQQSTSQQSSASQQQQQNRQPQQQQQQQKNQFQRDRSSQRNQHPDSSMNSNRGGNYGANDGAHNPNNSGPNLNANQKFQPGMSTRDLPPIETRADPNKKFTGRCRLFVGNLPHNTSEEKLKALFETYGEVGEVFLGLKSAYAFIKMDTRQNAEAARDALDCKIYENRSLRVRLAAHAAAIRIKNLSPVVTNELLAYAFRYFGEIERAIVVVDDKGKPTGEGFIEYSRKQSALYAVKRCQQECFILTTSPKPVLVEPFDQRDEDEGLPEKSINRNTNEFREEREVGPRFAESGSFEHSFALRWKDLYEVEKRKRERLEDEIEEARRNLQDQIEYSRLEHDTMQLRSKLQQMEDNKLKLQQMKEQHMTDAQQREELRRQQDLIIRQREESVLRRQQFGEDPSGLNQQENALRMQANALQDLLNNQERRSNNINIATSENNDDLNANLQSSSRDQTTGVADSSGLNMPFQLNNQPRSFADVAMMGQQTYLTSVQQQMGPPTTQNSQIGQPIFTTFLPAQPQQQQTPMQPHQPMQPQQPMQMSMDGVQPPPLSGYPLQHSQQTSSAGRQNKFSKQYNNHSNNINLTNNSRSERPRKRGRF